MSTAATNSVNLDQSRARHAWDAIQNLKNDSRLKDSDRKEYAGQAKKLSIRIMGSSLGQALAFILAKDNKGNLSRLHADLTDWVIVRRQLRAAKPGSLLESIIQGDSDFLRRATDETLAYLQWLTRFAEAEGLTEGQE